LHYRQVFLVSKNINYNCVLGVDFISGNKLTVKFEYGRNDGYCLVGPHGISPLCTRKTDPIKEPSVSGVILHSEQNDTESMLIESEIINSSAVTLVDAVVVPPRTEMIVRGRVAKSEKTHVGMIRPFRKSSNDLEYTDNVGREGLYFAHVVASPDQDRMVPMRVSNVSLKHIELVQAST
jgi:hypothetical protein